MRFKAHQGLIIVRWETDITGVFCRFHAVEAYKRARSVSFTGMWFGATSLFLGVLRTAWDTVSLLDLPIAPVDEPWTIHPAYCPHCASLIGGYAGVSRCSSCQETVAFGKCARCQTFHAVHISENAEWWLRCTSCGHSTAGSEAIEYSPTILVAYAAAELVAAIERAGIFGTQVIDRVLELLSAQIPLKDSGTTLARAHYAKVQSQESITILESTIRAHESALFFNLLANVLTRIQVEQGITQAHLDAANAVARRLGIDARGWITEFERAVFEEDGEEPWWTVLGVPRNASRPDIDSAYRRLAAQLHPDRGRQDDFRDVAQRTIRMKVVNAAYARSQKSRTEPADAPVHARRSPATSASVDSGLADEASSVTSSVHPSAEVSQHEGSRKGFFIRFAIATIAVAAALIVAVAISSHQPDRRTAAIDTGDPAPQINENSGTTGIQSQATPLEMAPAPSASRLPSAEPSFKPKREAIRPSTPSSPRNEQSFKPKSRVAILPPDDTQSTSTIESDDAGRFNRRTPRSPQRDSTDAKEATLRRHVTDQFWKSQAAFEDRRSVEALRILGETIDYVRTRTVKNQRLRAELMNQILARHVELAVSIAKTAWEEKEEIARGVLADELTFLETYATDIPSESYDALTLKLTQVPSDLTE